MLPNMVIPLVERVMNQTEVCSAYGGCVDGVMVSVLWEGSFPSEMGVQGVPQKYGLSLAFLVFLLLSPTLEMMRTGLFHERLAGMIFLTMTTTCTMMAFCKWVVLNF